MSISTGTLNLKFMQRGTPLKGSPSGPSTPTPSTPGTPVPAPSKFIQTDRDSEWQLPASKLKNLRVPALVSTPSKLKGRITYETSYLPFLERGEASGSSSGRARDEMQVSDEDNDEDEEDNVGGTMMVKGRMVFGQATKPEKTHFSDDDEEDSKETARHSVRGKGNKAVAPPSTPATKSKSTRTKATPNEPIASSSTPNRSQIQPQTPLPELNKAGFLRPAGFEDMPSTPNASSTPTTTTTSSKKNKKKRKSTQVDDAPVVETEVKSTTAGGKSGQPDVEEEELAQGARKKRRQRKTKAGREEDKADITEPAAVPEPSKGKSKKNKAKQVEMEDNDDEAEFDDFMDELIGEIERGE